MQHMISEILDQVEEAGSDVDRVGILKANDSQTETDKYTFEVTFKERGIVRGYYLPAVIDAIT